MSTQGSLSVSNPQSFQSTGASLLIADHGHMKLDHDDSDDGKDDDVYGEPSDNEVDNISSAYLRTSSEQHIDDDQPLGVTNAAIQAAHERIIEREREDQKNRTLSILEGNASAAEKRVGEDQRVQSPIVSPAREMSVRRDRTAMSMHRRSNSESFPLKRSGTLSQSNKQLLRSATSRCRGRSNHAADPLPSAVPMGVVSPGQASSNHNPSLFRTASAARGRPLPYSSEARTTGLGLDNPVPPHDLSHAMSRMGLCFPSGSRMVAYRIFVLNVQRYTVVNLPEEALIRQLLQATVAQMHLAPMCDRANDWAVFDVLPDLGIGTHRDLMQNDPCANMNE